MKATKSTFEFTVELKHVNVSCKKTSLRERNPNPNRLKEIQILNLAPNAFIIHVILLSGKKVFIFHRLFLSTKPGQKIY